MKHILKMGFAIHILIATNVSAGQPEDADTNQKQGNFTAEFQLRETLANQGDMKAQARLGTMYYMGQGVTQDYAEAVKWWQRAADQDLAIAQTGLGTMYYMGQGVTQDYAEAIKWYLRAANHGDAKAQGSLGVMYYMGQGVAQDYVPAHMWFSLAANHGDQKARKLLDIVAQHMSPTQIAKAQQMAMEWKP